MSERLDSVVKGSPLSDEPGLGALTLPGYLREIRARYADRECLVAQMPAGPVRWTYADLWDRSVEVARSLLACGVGKGSRVGIMMTNRPEWLAAAFGAALAGAVAVPISTFSTPPELQYLLQSSCVSILLFERNVLAKDFLAVLAELEPEILTKPSPLISPKLPFLHRLVAIGKVPEGSAVETWSEFLGRSAMTSPALVEATAASVHPSDVAMLFFSSGSTNKPKGILNTHRAVAIQLWRWRRIYGLENLRTWPANGFFWSGVFAYALGITFSSGGALVLQPTFEPAEALDLIAAEKVNMPLAWPHQWARLAEAPNWNDVDLSSLAYTDVRSPLARHPTVRSQWRDPHAYGVTEGFTICAAYEVGTPPEEVGESYGPPLPGNTIKIVDPLTGAVVRRGERGEIAFKGPTLMLGYIGIPSDETLDAEGFFHTGDGGYFDEAGRLFWEGRLNDIIKTGGANVSPLEVDAELATYPGVKVAQTIGLPHETLGEMVVACVAPHEGATLEEEAIREFLKERLASYKVPRRVLFLRDDELSLTGSAKVKTNELRELAAKRLGSAAS